MIRRSVLRFLTGLFSVVVFLLPGQALAATGANLVVPKEQVFLLPTTNNALQVVLQVTVENGTASPQDIQFVLPRGAESPTVQGVSKNDVQEQGQLLTIKNAAKPGTSTVVAAYSLPFSGQTSVQLTLHTEYPVYLMNIFVPIGNVALSAPGLMPDTQTTSIAGTDFRVFSHGAMDANSDWTASLSMLPNVTSNQAVQGLPVIGMDSQSAATTWQAIGNLAMAAAILVIALLGIRSTVGKGATAVKNGPQEALMRSWEEAERAFMEGRLEKSDYERRTSSIKRRLAQMRQMESVKR
ncbi:hypothetical protein [Alicyclobacillus ferrooxydans]|uniref:Uncharacterized protein n=1 Tax=Alicyclobacillus ferrooxydans TaxID=471514 RepID=A0A0P9CYM7_9BACL|nr:hypothetical protein [Alicyclobacillus ferrooxydans]KPV42041.1 hypothetical protein AN477_19940 [Alicyclobacillus ferrooxydans]